MTPYSIHFVAALALSAVTPQCFRNPLKKRLGASLIAPIVLYVLFYNFDYSLLGGVFPFLISYLGAFFSSFLALFAVSFRSLPVNDEPVPAHLPWIVLFLVLAYLCLCVIFASPWAIDTFPLSNVEAVLFTVFAGSNAGAEEFVISSLVKEVIIPAAQTLGFILITQFFLFLLLSKIKACYGAQLWKLKLELDPNRIKAFLWQCQKTMLVILSIYAGILLLILPGIVSSTPFRALFQQPVDSELYREHYVHPDSVQIKAPKEPRNLIVIFLESMETNFAQYTPEIVDLEKTSLHFPPGGQNVSGTSWTIAGITGKLCGIPLNMPMGIDEYHGKLPTYLPHAKCLMNVLADNGYNQLYSQGSSGDFTQKKTFWTIHGNVGIHDIKYYKSSRKIPEDYKVFWGFEDRKLYKFAKEELDSLANLDKPFAFYMLTVDTHQPYGYLDDSCKEALNSIGFEIQEKNHFPAALRCASIQLASFINWVKEQPWYTKTVISVMGDHAMPMLSKKAGLAPTDNLYWTNFIVNSTMDSVSNASSIKRVYSSLDIFPTLLESMGFELEGRSMGLGKSLYANEPTLLEKYGNQVLDSLLRERSIQYDYFLMGK